VPKLLSPIVVTGGVREADRFGRNLLRLNGGGSLLSLTCCFEEMDLIRLLAQTSADQLIATIPGIRRFREAATHNACVLLEAITATQAVVAKHPYRKALGTTVRLDTDRGGRLPKILLTGRADA
jgi:hypothetical protein